jgi:hypothetical protein
MRLKRNTWSDGGPLRLGRPTTQCVGYWLCKPQRNTTSLHWRRFGGAANRMTTLTVRFSQNKSRIWPNQIKDVVTKLSRVGWPLQFNQLAGPRQLELQHRTCSRLSRAGPLLAGFRGIPAVQPRVGQGRALMPS